jgi:putative ABC transport system permease protein
MRLGGLTARITPECTTEDARGIVEGIELAPVGRLIGFGGAWALTRLMKNLPFGVSPTDPPAFIVIASLPTFVALLACYIPARRATKVDPLTALRRQ